MTFIKRPDFTEILNDRGLRCGSAMRFIAGMAEL